MRRQRPHVYAPGAPAAACSFDACAGITHGLQTVCSRSESRTDTAAEAAAALQGRSAWAAAIAVVGAAAVQHGPPKAHIGHQREVTCQAPGAGRCREGGGGALPLHWCA